MKKLFTLVALLTVFMGVNAANWVKVYEKSYSEFSAFPYYVMGYVPEWVDGVMTDYGAMYSYKTDADMEKEDALGEGDQEVGTVTTQGGVTYHKIQLAKAAWHQYFIATGITTQLDGHYKVVAKVKSTAAATINVNMGDWDAQDGTKRSIGCNVSIPQSDDFVDVEWEYKNMLVTSSWLVAQPGSSTATIEWKSITVYEDQEGTRPVVWQQWITSDGKSIVPDVEHENKFVGDAEFGEWPEWALKKTDGVNINWRTDDAPLICAWALTMGDNNDSGEFNDKSLDGRARPYPAPIEAEEGNESNHVFAIHTKQIDKIDEDASIGWANQFFLEAPTSFNAGLTVKVKFRYKATTACSVATQFHKKNPSDYLFWNALGDLNFTDQWQSFEKTFTVSDDANGMWSIAFNLNSDEKNGRTPNDFYFDDFSWESMVLDEGFFVSGINTNITDKYDDLDNAIQFEDGLDVDGNEVLVATVGTKGDEDSYVNEVMISTIRGDKGAFMGSTLKPAKGEKIKNNAEDWIKYAQSPMAKLSLPGLGVWKIYLDTEFAAYAFEMLEGQEDAEKEPVDIVTNAAAIVVNGDERDDIKDDDHPAGTGQAWDNQFFIVANRALKSGEVTVLKFKYKASQGTTDSPVKTSTQCHGAPGAYMHWACIGDVKFTTEWQDFENEEFTIAKEANGMKSIAFNMAEIKDACKYEITDVQWYVKDAELEEGKTYENLIDAEGGKNFYVKEGAGTTPSVFGTPQHAITVAETVNGTAINTIAAQKQYEGAGVTIATKAAEGYEVDAVVVTCKTLDQAVVVKDNGVDDNGAHNFSFEMPADDVTVSVTFKEAATGINSIATDKKASTVIYNLAGQRVDNGFKGIVIKDGKKFVK